MRKILHIVGVRWWSALAAYAVDLASAQVRRGDRVTVSALKGSPSQREATRRDLASPLMFEASAPGLWRLARALRDFVRVEQPDVLHVHTGLGHVPAEWARRARRPAPLLVRSRADIRRPRSTPWNKWLFRQSDALLLSGGFMRSHLSGFGVKPDRIWVLPGTVDTAHFRPEALLARSEARRRLLLPQDGFFAGIIARLSPVKGHRDAIQACAVLGDLDPAFHLVIAGEEAQITRRDLSRLAAGSGVTERVHFVGRLDDVREVFAAIDVGIVASVGSEAVCRVAAEMMSCGLPLVATRVGVLPEMLVGEETGLLVSPGEPEQMARAIRRVHADAALRAALGARAREKAVATYGFTAVAERCDMIYARVLEGRNGT